MSQAFSNRAAIAACQDVLERATGSAGQTPAAVASVVATRGKDRFVFEFASGYLFEDVTRRKDEGAAASIETVFDLASLTKVLATTLIAADAVATGLLSLDATPFEQWPNVTVAHVLAHEAGLEAHRDYFRPIVERGDAGLLSARQEIVQAVLATPPIAPPGTTTKYSDLGFIALGAYLEHALGAPLATLFDRAAQKTFGRSHGLRFVDLREQGVHPAGPRVAPTEHCSWRGRVVQGQVHDDNCFAMGGVAGHAGLFGDLRSVADAGVFFLEAAREPSHPLFECMQRFARGTGATHEGARPLGFDRATPEGTTGGALSADAFGHLGFTGTSLWIDPAPPSPADGAVYVLLTNRVHPSRDREGIRDLRLAFHRAAAALVDTLGA